MASPWDEFVKDNTATPGVSAPSAANPWDEFVKDDKKTEKISYPKDSKMKDRPEWRKYISGVGRKATDIPIAGPTIHKSTALAQSMLHSLLGTGESGDTWQERYQKNKQSMGADKDYFEKTYPKSGTAAKVAGTVAAYTPLAKSVQGLTYSTKLLPHMVSQGGLGGVVSGLDERIRNPKGSVGDTAKAIGTGTVLGSLGPAVSKLISPTAPQLAGATGVSTREQALNLWRGMSKEERATHGSFSSFFNDAMRAGAAAEPSTAKALQRAQWMAPLAGGALGMLHSPLGALTGLIAGRYIGTPAMKAAIKDVYPKYHANQAVTSPNKQAIINSLLAQQGLEGSSGTIPGKFADSIGNIIAP